MKMKMKGRRRSSGGGGGIGRGGGGGRGERGFVWGFGPWWCLWCQWGGGERALDRGEVDGMQMG